MLLTVIVMAAVAAVAVGAAWWQQQRHRPAPTVTRGAPPGNLDRRDFRAGDAPLLIAVFTSETCSSCAAVWNELASHESDRIAVQNVEVGADANLHRRYKIESVPTAVVVDHRGDTQAAFVGPLGPDHRELLATIVAAHG